MLIIMPGFFKEINTVYGWLEFHFIGICGPEGHTFFASVRDPSHKAHVLELQQGGGEWKLASPGVPLWLQEAEEALVAVVQAHAGRG